MPNSRIHFKNQPHLSDAVVDAKFNERKKTLFSLLEPFISSHELFKDKEVFIEFPTSGVSSLVCFIECNAESQKYVLKIPLNPHLEGEALFLKTWEKAGVSVPHVFSEGKIGEHPFIIMSYIDAPLLKDAPRKPGVNFSVEHGNILRMMHTPKTHGYGKVVAGKPQFGTMKEWLLGPDMQKRITYVQEHNLLTAEHGELTKVFDILIEYCEKVPETSYCHFDFGESNMLATQPTTIIDPDPTFNIGMMDLARTIILTAGGGYKTPGEGLKKGYFQDNGNYDTSILQASLILSATMKFPYWHRKEKTKQIKYVQEYLVATKHNLKY